MGTGTKELVLRVSAEFDADNTELKRALETIQLETRQMGDEFTAAAARSNKALDTIGLGAQEQVSRFDKLKSSISRLGDEATNFAKTSGSIKGAIDNVAKAMAPWNQAFELGGKVLNFAGDALDAYAKRVPAAREEIERLKGAFTAAKDAVLAYAGATMTLSGLKNGEGAVFDLANIATFGQAGRNLEDRLTREANAGRNLDFSNIQSGEDAFGNYNKASAPVDPWATTSKVDEATFYTASQKLNDALAKRQKKPGASKVDPEIAEAAKERAALIVAEYEEANRIAMERMAQDNLDNAVGGIGSLSMLGIPSPDSLNTAMAEVTSETDRLFAEFNAKQYEKYRAAKEQTFLESTFGKIDEFDAYKTAFDGLNVAVQSSMQAWISGSMSLGTAIKKGIGDALSGLASQLAIESLKHGAYAIGSLAFGDVRGAATHGAAAAAFGAGAVAAAAAAKKLGGSAAADIAAAKDAGKAAGGGAGGDGAKGKADSDKPSSSGGGEVIQNTNIFVGDYFDGDVRRRQQLVDEALERQRRRRDA